MCTSENFITYQVPKIQLHVHQPSKIQAANKFQLRNILVLESVSYLILLALVWNAAERACSIFQDTQQQLVITEVKLS